MSNDKLVTGEGVLIGRDHWDVPVRVELRTYLRFTRRLDSQLRRLAIRWAHVASPWARGVRTSPDQSGKSIPPMI